MHKLILTNDFVKSVVFNCAVCTNCLILHLFLHIFMYSTFIYFYICKEWGGRDKRRSDDSATIIYAFLLLFISVFLCLYVNKVGGPNLSQCRIVIVMAVLLWILPLLMICV